jgi:hypothetical protein
MEQGGQVLTVEESGREMGWTGSKDDLWHRLGYYVVDSH